MGFNNGYDSGWTDAEDKYLPQIEALEKQIEEGGGGGGSSSFKIVDVTPADGAVQLENGALNRVSGPILVSRPIDGYWSSFESMDLPSCGLPSPDDYSVIQDWDDAGTYAFSSMEYDPFDQTTLTTIHYNWNTREMFPAQWGVTSFTTDQDEATYYTIVVKELVNFMGVTKTFVVPASVLAKGYETVTSTDGDGTLNITSPVTKADLTSMISQQGGFNGEIMYDSSPGLDFNVENVSYTSSTVLKLPPSQQGAMRAFWVQLTLAAPALTTSSQGGSFSVPSLFLSELVDAPDGTTFIKDNATTLTVPASAQTVGLLTFLEIEPGRFYVTVSNIQASQAVSGQTV